MKKVPEAEAALELDSAIRGGAVLARQFYRELQTFEASPEGIRIYYPTMMKNVEMDYTADGICRGTEERSSPSEEGGTARTQRCRETVASG